jgi:osmoprotectant transport system substrate-binding protein
MKRFRPLVLLAVLLSLIASACGSSSSNSKKTSTSKPAIKIGAQNFGESAILAQIYGQALVAKGYSVKQVALGGARSVVYPSFKAGDINLTPEYAASALEFLNKNAGEATANPDDTVKKLRDRLKPLKLTALNPAPAIDTNSFVVTKQYATQHGLKNISDLSKVAADVTFGGPPDCPTNAYCVGGLKTRYGIDLTKKFKAFDFGGPLTVQALKSGTIQVALLFSTSGVIAQEGWVVLKDDKGMFNADNVVPVLTDGLVTAYGSKFTDLLNQVSASITTSELTTMNKRSDIDKADPSVIAKDFLTAKHFV